MAPSPGNQLRLMNWMREPDPALADVFLPALVERGRVSLDFTPLISQQQQQQQQLSTTRRADAQPLAETSQEINLCRCRKFLIKSAACCAGPEVAV
jgi:hypothetical protein